MILANINTHNSYTVPATITWAYWILNMGLLSINMQDGNTSIGTHLSIKATCQQSMLTSSVIKAPSVDQLDFLLAGRVYVDGVFFVLCFYSIFYSFICLSLYILMPFI